MNLRFPEVFGLLLFVAFLCSFALPRSASGRVENSFQFIFAPVSGPIQWMIGGREQASRPDQPVLTGPNDEVARLRQEKVALMNYVETLRGQLETLAHREAEAGRIGGELSGKVSVVKVIAPDANGRDVLRLAGTSAGVVEKDQAVVYSGGLVGRVLEVGAGNQSSVRLITDRGFKLLGRFGRYKDLGDGTFQLAMLDMAPTVIQGVGGGLMRIDGLTLDEVTRAGLKAGETDGDIVLLSDATTAQWPIEVHGRRVGRVVHIGEKLDTPRVAEIFIRPEEDLLKLKDVSIVTKR